MKPLFLICFLLMSSMKLFGQVLSADSLRVRDILHMGYLAKKEGDFKRALLLFDSAATIAKEAGLEGRAISAQWNKFPVFIQLGNLEEAEKLGLKLLDGSMEDESIQLRIYNGLGQVESRRMNPDKALFYYNKGVDIATRLNDKGKIADFYMNMGIAYYLKKNYEKALAYFKKSEIYEKERGGNGLSNTYNNTAALYQQLGNNEEALEYLLKSLELAEKEVHKNWTDIALRYTNLAILLKMLHRPYEALAYLSKSNRILEENKLKQTTLYLDNLEVKGVIYMALNEWEKAETILLKEIKERESKQEKRDIALCNAYLNLSIVQIYTSPVDDVRFLVKELLPKLDNAPLLEADAYGVLHRVAIIEQDTSLAKKNLEIQLAIYQSVYKDHKNELISDVYLNLAKLTTERNGKLFYLHQASLGIGTPNKNALLSEILSENKFIDLNQLGIIWSEIASTYLNWYKVEENRVDLDSARCYAQWSSAAIKEILKNNRRNKDKKFKIKDLQKISEINVQIAQLQNTTENGSIALNAMEDNKSIILQSVLKEEDINQIINLSEEIQSQKKSLEESMALIQKEIIDARGERNENLLFDLEEELFEKEIALKELQERIEKQYPKYKQLLGARDSVMTIEGIRKQLLQDHTGLIEYLVTDSTVYQVIVTKEEVRILDLELKKTKLDSIIDDFRKSISDYTFLTEEGNAAQNLYTQTSYELYEELLEEGLRGLEGIRKLIIIPDYTIGHIPFEALTMSLKPTASYEEMDYLLHKYQVRYSYSTQMLYEGSEEKDKLSGLEVLGMAGSYDPVDSVKIQERKLTQQKIRKTLIPLPAVLREVDYIAGIAKGTYYTGIEATEANFKKHAGSYGILHLAMHGVLNTEHPMASAMIFTEEYDSIEDNFLYGHEIAQMDLEASLVVLSACETGYGKFEQGEGVMSMARSFMYAGVPSAVVSLWQVNDVSTSIIMKMFYEYLGGGLSKSEALTAAKQEYLQNVTGIAAHPAFWAAFVCIGEDTPLINVGIAWYWWLILVVLIGAGAILIARQQKQN